jgi:hypothetical protein
MQWRTVLYEEGRSEVLSKLRNGEVEYADLSSWSYQDKFFAFLLGMRFFEQCAQSYPSPRKKEEVPVWFLLCCEVQMRLHTTSAHSRLPGILKNGPILSRVKFNIGGINGGFNGKNRKERAMPVDSDCVRKFVKDTPADSLRDWYGQSVASHLRSHRAFEKHGIFVLDQTHLVVPDNAHYEDSAFMPVDEHGQLIDMSHMSDEQKSGVPRRRCYALSLLVHIGKQQDYRIIAGYQLGAGTDDELVQGQPIINRFTAAVGKDVMKLLVVDRGYIDAAFINEVYYGAHADILIPMRDTMDMYGYALRAVESEEWKGTWCCWKKEDDFIEEVTLVEHLGMWEGCKVDLYTSLMRKTELKSGKTTYWGLLSTFEPKSAKEAFQYYEMRIGVEEVNRQIKCYWYINRFTSPHRSLIESHVLFTLLTYSLVQMHLINAHCQSLTNKTIETLKHEEAAGNNCVIVYFRGNFAVFGIREYTGIVAQLSEPAKERIMKWVTDDHTPAARADD